LILVFGQDHVVIEDLLDFHDSLSTSFRANWIEKACALSSIVDRPIQRSQALPTSESGYNPCICIYTSKYGGRMQGVSKPSS
jgi:Mor family transcriptional regulator